MPVFKKQDRDAVQRLQLFARGVVEGLTGGRHRSPFRGSSVEFKEHREYVAGDELRTIDWKLFGKTDRLFIRQYEDETNLRAMILLDQSGSMGYPGSGQDGKNSKHDFAVRLAASLAMLLLSQQDAAGLATWDTKVRQLIPPRSTVGHLKLILQALVDSQPGGETSLSEALRDTVARLQRRGMVILVSDCFDEIEKLAKALGYLRFQGHDIIVVQVWHPDELHFPFRNRTEFQSLENGTQHLVDPNALRKAYLKRVQEFREQLERATSKLKIDLVSCTSDEDCGDVLSRLIAMRQGRGRNRK